MKTDWSNGLLKRLKWPSPGEVIIGVICHLITIFLVAGILSFLHLVWEICTEILN